MSFLKQNKHLIILIFILLVIPFFVYAKGLVPCGGDGEPRCGIEDIFVLIARATNWLIAMSGLYAVYKIIEHGFGLAVLSNGNEANITKHRNGIANAIVGMTMALMAFMVINTLVNLLLLRAGPTETNRKECQIDLTNPLTYLTIKYPTNCSGTK